MRTLSPAMQTLLASGEDIEPVMILGIRWNDAGGPLYYADRDLTDGTPGGQIKAQGRILEIGTIDESQRSDSAGAAGSLSVVLDDRDGALKAILDARDIHKVRVDVHQSFMGLDSPTGDKVKVFSGQISTPIVWDEGTRTLAFDVVTKLEDNEVGWSAEMGDYSSVAVELLGNPWPLAFGTVHHSPCLRLQNIPTAFTTEPFGVVDHSLAPRMDDLKALLADAIEATLFATDAAIDDTGSPLAFGKLDQVANDPQVKKYVQMQVDIQEEMNRLGETLSWQTRFLRGTVDLVPTVYVNQPYSGLFRVGDNLFLGNLTKMGGEMSCVPQVTPGSPASTAALRQGFQFYNSGSQAVIAGNYRIRYVAAITPGAVKKVWAMRSFNGLRQMAEVPDAYYSVAHESIGAGMTVTYIDLLQPLSTIAMIQNRKTQIWENGFGKGLPAHIINQIDWEDELYVSFESTVGPNPVAIMEWLIDNFSANGYDPASFASAGAKVAGFPMNFTLADNPNVMDLLADIAYQARCLIYLRDDVFHLLYLPEQGTPAGSISEDDVVAGTLKVTTTATESLVTKYSATYRPDYSPFFDQPVKIVLRYGIPKYGVHAEEHDFFTYNNFDAVQSAATFWLIRKSQTWKVLQARLFITRLDLEVFDFVTLDFDKPYVARGPVVGMITRCAYDSSGKYVDVEVWCPVLLGEMATNDFAFPASADRFVEWPQYHDLAGGGGGGGISSPSLPPSNPRTEPAGSLDVNGDVFRQAAPISLGQYATGEEWAPPFPDPIPRSKSFPRTPLPVEDPTQDYKYADTPDPSVPAQTGVFPGVVQDKIGPSTKNPDVTMYNVKIYNKTMTNKGETHAVGQLQIAKDDTIPPGTWVEVVVNQGRDADKKPFFERTMQVPVWLE